MNDPVYSFRCETVKIKIGPMLVDFPEVHYFSLPDANTLIINLRNDVGSIKLRTRIEAEKVLQEIIEKFNEEEKRIDISHLIDRIL